MVTFVEEVGEGSRVLMHLQQMVAPIHRLCLATGVVEGLCPFVVPAPSYLQEPPYEGPCDAEVCPNLGSTRVSRKRGECGPAYARR